MSHPVSSSRGVALLAIAQAVVLGAAVPATRSFAQPQPAAPRVPGSGERRVSLDFVGADVNDVAKALSVQSGVNVVLMPSVKGNVTVRLVGLSPEEALRKTAAAVGADVRKVDNTYFMGSTAELRGMMAQNGVRATLVSRHTPTEDMKALLQSAFPYLTVEAAGKSNVLVLAGAQEDVTAAVAMATQADVAPAAARVEPPKITRETYTAKFAPPEKLMETVAKAMPELKVSFVNKTLVLEGVADAQTQAVKLLAALDVAGSGGRVVRAYELKYLHPHQAAFTLKPLFPELTVQAGFEPYSPQAATFQPLAVDASKGFNTGQAGGSGASSSSSAGGQGGAGGAAGGVNGGAQDINGPGSRSRTVLLAGTQEMVEQATQVLSTLDVAPRQLLIEARVVDMSPEHVKALGFRYNIGSSTGITIGELVGAATPFRFGSGATRTPFEVNFQAFEQQKDVKVLARPNISVIDGEEASIFIGDIIRYERLESNGVSGQTFTIETVPVGVALLCRPRLNSDGRITLNVHPVVSTVTGFTGRNQDIPITSSREASSVLLMQDGETIAIGGLMKEQEIKSLTKIPFLGDIPFFGQLFRHRNNDKTDSEVTIFLTAKLQKT
jgi:general secretion pathway protein D